MDRATGPSAEMRTAALFATREVIILKLVFLCPAVTVTRASTVARSWLLLLKLNVVPPAGAGLERVTVAVDDIPPVRLWGESSIDGSA